MTLRHDQAQLCDRQRYVHSFDQRLLFSDVDSFGHVNNATAARLFEEGRQAIVLAAFGPCRHPVLVRSAIEYLAEGRYPGSLWAGTAILRLGGSSLTFVHAAFQDDTPIALAEAIMVCAEGGRSTPLTADQRLQLETFLLRG